MIIASTIASRLKRGAALAACLVSIAAVAVAQDTVPLLEPGQDNYGWRFDPGGEFPGAKGGLSVDTAVKKDDKPSLKLEADFTGGGNYVQALRDVPGLDVDTIAFWLKADAAVPSVTLRVIDQSICHQIRLVLKPTAEWQAVSLPLRAFFKNKLEDPSVEKYESWGGTNDSAWHGPCKMLCLMAVPPPDRKTVTLWIHDLRVVQPPPAASTTILPVALSAERSAPGSFVKITYRWQPKEPLLRDNSAFVHFVDDAGKTVAQDDHTPSVVTGSPGWNGQVRYERRVVLPATLPDGTYKILAGLYHSVPQPPGWRRELLVAGPGVTDAGESRYQVGTLVVDKTAPLPKADTENPPSLKLDGYTMTFGEEFDGKLDVSPWGPGTRWIAHTPWAGDFGDAAFGDPAEGHPFTIENGVLRIEARKDEAFAKVDGYKRPWRAGLLASNDRKGAGFSQKYGYFEMRAKLPGGPGVWPAFWLSSSFDRTDPKAGADGSVEIDVIEFYGHNPGAYQSAVHVWKPDPHRAEGSTVTTRLGEVSGDFHRYGVKVEPDFVTMYFDGVEVWKAKTPPEHKRPLMLLVNLALGSGWPIDKTPSPSYMYVDYVRAYAKKP